MPLNCLLRGIFTLYLVRRLASIDGQAWPFLFPSPLLMKTLLSPLLFLGLLTPLTSAQDLPVNDDGTPAVESFSGQPSTQAPGSLPTHFNAGNGFAGNTFDITPNVDIEITGMDFHARNLNLYDIDVYYKLDTSVGFEQIASAWTLLGSATGIQGNGSGVGSFADLSGNGVVFSAGQKYGIYMDNSNYSTSGGIYYTNGVTTPETYSNADVTLEAYSGTQSPAFTGGAPFTPRIWNGTLYYDGGAGSGPSIEVRNLVAGSTCEIVLSNGTAGGGAVVGYSLHGSGPISSPFGDVYLSRPYKMINMTYDANGDSSLSLLVPGVTSGVNVWVHAVDLGSSTLTNALALTIQ